MAEAAPAAPAPTDIVGRLDAILASENAPPPEKKPAAQAETEQQQTEGEAQPEEEVEPSENKTVEGADAPAEEPVTEISLDQLEALQIEVEVEGEKGKVVEKPTIKELKLGYMRQKDYQTKTAEVARQRKEQAEHVRQAVESERTQHLENLKNLQDVLIQTTAPELKDVNWDHLAANDAFEYVRLKNRAEQIVNALSTIQGKAKEVSAKLQADQKAAREAAHAKARTQLETDIPGFSDALYQTLMKSGETVGFKPEEVATWADPRAIKLLHKAYLYDQLKAGKPSAGQKVPVTPPKVLKPGASAGNSQAQQRQAEAMKRLQGSGNIDDAAAVIRARLG